MHNCGGLCVENNRWLGGLGRAAGPAAQPPTRAQPVCFDAVETACGRKAAVCRNLRGGVVYRRLLRGGREKDCNHIWWGKIFRKLDLYGYRRGVIWSVIAYRRGEFYIGLQFVRLAAVAFLLLV